MDVRGTFFFNKVKKELEFLLSKLSVEFTKYDLFVRSYDYGVEWDVFLGFAKGLNLLKTCFNSTSTAADYYIYFQMIDLIRSFF
jgi:hypothetical protein